MVLTEGINSIFPVRQLSVKKKIQTLTTNRHGYLKLDITFKALPMRLEGSKLNFRVQPKLPVTFAVYLIC